MVKAIINRTAANEALETLHYKYKIERIKADKESNEEERKRTDLLISLENSGSFATTHSLISALQESDDWSYEEKEILSLFHFFSPEIFPETKNGDTHQTDGKQAA